MVDGEEKQQPLSFSPRESLLGLLLNASAMAGWASIYEIVLAISNKPSNFPLAAGTATLAYLIDYHVVPKRLVPGIEKHMSRNGLIVCYIALALGLWLSPRTSELEERNI